MSRISTTIATSRLLWRAFIRGKPHIAYAGGWLGHHDLGDEALFHADGKLFNNASLMLYPHDDNRAVSAYKKFHGNFLMGLLAFAAAILYLAVLWIVDICLNLGYRNILIDQMNLIIKKIST